MKIWLEAGLRREEMKESEIYWPVSPCPYISLENLIGASFEGLGDTIIPDNQEVMPENKCQVS
jgi:hypothetical protein